MYRFSLIDPQTLLLVSIAVFSLTGMFMAVAAHIRKERAYAWLAVGALCFAVGWALTLSRSVIGITVLTLPAAEVSLLLLPVFLLCATLDFLRRPGIRGVLIGAVPLLIGVFWLLMLYMDNQVVPGAMTSSLNAACYLGTARLFHKHAYPNNLVGGIIIAAVVIVGTAFILRTTFLMYGVAIPSTLDADTHNQLVYNTLLVNLMGIFLLSLCFPLFDFLRVQNSLESVNSQLTQLAERDPLTGLYNRRVLMRRLEAELQRHARLARPLSAILFDIDHFKRVNDEHGHAVGDRVLQQVGSTAQGLLRGSDILARYGGEELAVLLPGAPIGAAVRVAERIRTALGNTPATSIGSAPVPRVTCSFGVATATSATGSAGDLLRAADAALYAAKRGGRDRVCADSADPAGSASVDTSATVVAISRARDRARIGDARRSSPFDQTEAEPAAGPGLS